MIDGTHLYTVWVAGPEEQPGQSRIVEKGVGGASMVRKWIKLIEKQNNCEKLQAEMWFMKNRAAGQLCAHPAFTWSSRMLQLN